MVGWTVIRARRDKGSTRRINQTLAQIVHPSKPNSDSFHLFLAIPTFFICVCLSQLHSSQYCIAYLLRSDLDERKLRPYRRRLGRLCHATSEAFWPGSICIMGV